MVSFQIQSIAADAYTRSCRFSNAIAAHKLMRIIHRGGFVVEGGRVTKTLGELQPMDGYSNSTHSNVPSPNAWRYMVGKGWNVSADETVKGI